MILVAEDDFISQKMIDFLFSELGLQYRIVNNGQEAFDEFRKNSYSVLLLDVNMPVMSGFQAAMQIRNFEKETDKEPVPIYVLSALEMPEIVKEFSQADIDGIILKPLTKEKIKNILSNNP